MTREEALEQLKIEYIGEWDADIQAKFISIEALWDAAREHEIEILRELLEEGDEHGA